MMVCKKARKKWAERFEERHKRHVQELDAEIDLRKKINDSLVCCDAGICPACGEDSGKSKKNRITKLMERPELESRNFKCECGYERTFIVDCDYGIRVDLTLKANSDKNE